ncbi:hypothetical protein Tco_1436062, partial [Tanacetum coccineum]
YKIDQAAIIAEAAAQRALLQETIEKNKVEADRQFAEIMNAIKTQQLSTTTPPVILPPPTRPMPTPIYSNFSGFDSQGFSIPCGSNGAFLGSFKTGNTTAITACYRFFPGPNQTILPPLVHGNERGWVPGTDYRLCKLKMPFFNGDDVYGWVYLTERFFDIQDFWGETQGCDDVPRGSCLGFDGVMIRSGYHQKDRKPSQNDKTEHGMEKTVQNQGQRSGYHQKDRKPSQNDKTEHGMEKTVQNQGQSPKMPKSESIQKNQQSNRSRN